MRDDDAQVVRFEIPTPVAQQFPRLDDYAGVWALEPGAMRLQVEALRRLDLSAHIMGGVRNPIRLESQLSKLPAAGGKSVAVITCTGLLCKQVPSMTLGTSTIQLRRDIRAAARDPDVSAILLAMDSPGGTAAGTEALAREVKLARKSKPVWAQIEDLGASAAYFVASQAEKIFANVPSALVGSIGTLAVVYDLSGMAEKDGVRVLVFATGPLKGAGVPGAAVTDDQAEHFQGIVDGIQQSFDRAVRLGRGLSDKQLTDVRSGGVFLAGDALEKRLIDGIQSMDATLEQLAQAGRKAAQAGRPAGAAKEAMTMDFAQFVQSLGLDPENLTTAQQVRLKEMHNQLHGEDDDPPTPPRNGEWQDSVRERRRQEAVEEQRIAAIRRICKQYGEPGMAAKEGEDPVSVAAHAIGEGWDKNRAELECLRISRPKPPAVGGRKNGPVQGEILEAALLAQLGTPNREKQYRPETLELADKHFRNVGLQQLLLLAAAANGYDCGPGTRIHGGNLREVLRHAFPPIGIGQAGFSSVTLPGILGNVANKQLLAGYTEEDETWREVSRVVSATNFHTRTYYRMLDNMEYEQVGLAGEIKHGSVDQESYTATLKTFAKMFALTRARSPAPARGSRLRP